MKSFEQKAKDYYGEVVINKGLISKAGFGARAIPVYVAEWIISQFMGNDQLDEDAREKIVHIVGTYLPQKADKNVLMNRLMNHEQVKILDDFRVSVNLSKNARELNIPILDLNNGSVAEPIVEDNPMLLSTGMWGLGTLQYIPPDGDEIQKGIVRMVEFKPFQSPGIDLDYFKEGRKNFTLEEWVDFLTSSCQFNPDIIDFAQKMLLLSRIIPLVQPRVNLAELAPKGTGKSFIFDNISRYAAVIPGGKISAPALFFNSQSKQIGLIPRYDVVVVDEVQKIRTDQAGEAMASLKMYLESGRYRRATGDMGTAEAGFAMLGNISMGADRMPLYEAEGIFSELPQALQESAFIDRIHGLIEGWFMPRITKDSPSKTLGFKGDFFSEVLHQLRVNLQFADYVSQKLNLPGCEDMRDKKAIQRISEGYLKLLFPDLNLTDEEFVEFCVNPAVRMRQQVRDELAKLDPEFAWTTINSAIPDEFQATHPTVKPNPKDESAPVDPLATNRVVEPAQIEIKEGQTGVSYEKLFMPYLKNAKKVKIVDPYLRYAYQIQNFVKFCELMVRDEGNMELTLVTGSDSSEQELELATDYDDLQKSLSASGINFSYSFDSNIHDRFIETDTGWRINLGRGLDIFQKPQGRFTLGAVDQTKRRCKGTTITYLKIK